MCMRCQKFYCRNHFAAQSRTCLPPSGRERREMLAARQLRRDHDAELARATRHLGLHVPCQNKRLTVRVVDAGTGQRIAGLVVRLRLGDLQPDSQGGGDYHFSNLSDGTVYTVRVAGTRRYGEVLEQSTATAGQTRRVTIPLTPFSLVLAVDADRDGTAEDPEDFDNPEDFSEWTSGEGEESAGAVVFYNNLSAAGAPSRGESGDLPQLNAGDNVAAAGEAPYLAPLEIVARGWCSRSWTATLTAQPAGRVRVLHEGQAVLGPGQGAWTVPVAQNGRLRCRMEATAYPKAGFKGEVTLTLTLRDSGGEEVSSQDAVVRVSPWIMHNALDELQHVYALDIAAVPNMHAASYLAIQHFLADLEAALGQGRVVRVDFSAYNLGPKADLFIRDVMSVGYSSLPGAGGAARHVPVVLGPVHSRDASNLHFFPLSLSGPARGFFLPSGALVGSDETCNYFGNFLCSPPTDPDPLGRIFYGTNNQYNLDADLLGFLSAQLQPLTALDVRWLAIRHVDEVVSFVPDVRAGFAVVMPSPDLAVTLLKQAVEADEEAALFAGLVATFPALARAAGVFEAEPVAGLLGNGKLMGIQRWVEERLTALEEQIVEALGIGRVPVIRLPVLYRPSEGELLSAYTPDVVNMLVGTNADGTAELCIPKPYGPLVNGVCVFEREIVRLLAPTGNRVHWIRDMNMYHSSDGEAHCATNSVRKPSRAAGWWTLD